MDEERKYNEIHESMSSDHNESVPERKAADDSFPMEKETGAGRTDTEGFTSGNHPDPREDHEGYVTYSPTPGYMDEESGEGDGKAGFSRAATFEYQEVSPSPGKGRGLMGTLAMVLVGAVLGSGITMASGRYLFGSEDVVRQQSTVSVNQALSTSTSPSKILTAPPAETGVTAENQVAQAVTPSVVGITTKTKVSQPSFFGSGGSGYVEGVGSGVILSSDGYIVTNSHVVDNGEAGNITVVFNDQTTAPAEVLWSDAALDVAIVKVSKAGLSPVTIGSSEAVKVGDKAIAIGNPLGLDLQSTLTSGYISGLDRSITIQSGGTMSGLIQTDAAINEGNSGGALLNAAGQLIGINTAKAGGGTSGIGFAIPVDTIKPIIEKVMAEGSFKSVYLGVTGMNVASIKAQDETINFDGTEGVYIMDVMDGTAAAQAGLKSGDIVTKIDSYPIQGMTELKKALLNYQVGDEVTVTYFRDNKEKSTSLRFAQDSSNIENFFNQQEP
ncbi:MAG: trypsin-like peptidase domain-containing protein [Clostridiaceae bacterium]